jgi:hypothetical protein
MQCLSQPVVLWGIHIGSCHLLLLLLLLLPGNAPLNVMFRSTSHELPQPVFLRRLHIVSSSWLLLLHTLASVVNAFKCMRVHAFGHCCLLSQQTQTLLLLQCTAAHCLNMHCCLAIRPTRAAMPTQPTPQLAARTLAHIHSSKCKPWHLLLLLALLQVPVKCCCWPSCCARP